MRYRNIISRAYLQTYTDSQGFGIVGGGGNNSSNSLYPYNVWAGAQNVKLVFENAMLNWGTVSDSSALSIDVGLRGYTGATANGVAWVQQTGLTLAAGMSRLTPTFAVSLSAGDTLKAATYALATTASKPVPGTRHFYDPGMGEGGATLTPKISGESSTVINNLVAYTPAMVLGRVRTKSFVGFGHSVVVGVEDGADGGWVVRGADLLERPAHVIGRGGSIPASWNSTANFDSATYGDVVLMQHLINSVSEYYGTNPTDTGTQFVDAQKSYVRANVRRLKALGCTVIMCTENFTGDSVSKKIEFRAAWNAYIRSGTGLTYLGADDYLDFSPYLETATDNQVPVTGATNDIHGNHEQMGEAMYDAFKTGGRLTSYIATDTSELDEVFSETFWGSSTSVGTTTSNFLEWKYPGEPNRLSLNGTGAMRVTYPGGGNDTHNAIALGQTGAGGTIEIFATSSPFNASTTDQQGWLVGFVSTNTSATTSAELSGASHEGYSLRVYQSGTTVACQLYRYNSDSVGGGLGNISLQTYVSSAFASGDICSVRMRRAVSGGNNVFTITVYKNGVALGAPYSATDTAPLARYLTTLYPFIGAGGNTATHPEDGALWDFVRFSYDNPVTIAAVTPTSATMEIVPGDRRSFSAVVTESAPTTGVSAGQSVTCAVTGITDATVGGSTTTDASGVALFTDSGGLYVPSTATVGDTGTITMTCGGVTGEIAVTVVAAYSSGSGEGNMTLSAATATTALTSAAYTKIGDDGDALDVSCVGGTIYLRTVATGGDAPSATLVGIPLGFRESSPRSYTLSGVDLYARSEGSPALAVVQK